VSTAAADSAELGDGEGQRSHELLVGVDDILRESFRREEASSARESADGRLLAVAATSIRAIGRTIDSDFALGAAADCADCFALCRTEANSFALFADRAGHGVSSFFRTIEQDTAAPLAKDKSAERWLTPGRD